MSKTILLGLNELNFDYIKYYISQGELPNFKLLFEKHQTYNTTSENKYELLEPWIQWVTVSTGLTYEEHQVFRLGDIVNRKDLLQIYEELEASGRTVGAVSPFNADNRLKNPKFFVPDPWTKTKASGNKLLQKLSKVVSDAVNENAKGGMSFQAAITLIEALIRVVPIKKYPEYIKLLISIKSKVGAKALFLDKLLGDLFIQLWKKHTPDFSKLFLNSGAHIQHHYLFNSVAYKGDLKNPEWYCPSSQDPLLAILKVYDVFLKQLMSLDNLRLFVCTGLHQKPHKHNTYYWRLNEHGAFLKLIGIQNYSKVIPRMSRDFLVEFNSDKEALEAQITLEKVLAKSDSQRVFTVDNRGVSLFVELTYPNDIPKGFQLTMGGETLNDFNKYVSFVAIKNGEHDGIGYLVDTGVKKTKEEIEIPLTDVNAMIKNAVLA